LLNARSQISRPASRRLFFLRHAKGGLQVLLTDGMRRPLSGRNAERIEPSVTPVTSSRFHFREKLGRGRKMRHAHHSHPDELMNPDLLSRIVLVGSVLFVVIIGLMVLSAVHATMIGSRAPWAGAGQSHKLQHRACPSAIFAGHFAGRRPSLRIGCE
jgi:hypothetical protein